MYLSFNKKPKVKPTEYAFSYLTLQNKKERKKRKTTETRNSSTSFNYPKQQDKQKDKQRGDPKDSKSKRNQKRGKTLLLEQGNHGNALRSKPETRNRSEIKGNEETRIKR